MGTLDTKRDWGYAGDYVKAMWLMLQQDEPDDYVVATGETHSIEELVERAFAEVGIDDWQRYVRQDPKFYRPAEVDLLIGDARQGPHRARLGARGRFRGPRQADGPARPRRRGEEGRHHPRVAARALPERVRRQLDSNGISVIASISDSASGTAPALSL